MAIRIQKLENLNISTSFMFADSLSYSGSIPAS